MTRDEVMRMAREANRYASHQTGDTDEWHEIRDERFAELVAAAAREALLAACKRYDAWADQTICLDPELAEIRVQMRAAIAAAEGEK